MAIVHVVARGSYQGHLAGLGCQAREQTVGGASGAAEHKRCLVCGGRNRRGRGGGPGARCWILVRKDAAAQRCIQYRCFHYILSAFCSGIKLKTSQALVYGCLSPPLQDAGLQPSPPVRCFAAPALT